MTTTLTPEQEAYVRTLTDAAEEKGYAAGQRDAQSDTAARLDVIDMALRSAGYGGLDRITAVQQLARDATDAMTRCDDLNTAHRRVRDLHTPHHIPAAKPGSLASLRPGSDQPRQGCDECTPAGDWSVTWPCATIRALDGAP